VKYSEAGYGKTVNKKALIVIRAIVEGS